MMKTYRIPEAAAAVAAALLLAASCGHVQKNAAAEPSAAATSSQTGTITSALAETEVIENTNHIFTPYPAIDDLVEANVEVMPDSVSKEVDLDLDSDGNKERMLSITVLTLMYAGSPTHPCLDMYPPLSKIMLSVGSCS